MRKTVFSFILMLLSVSMAQAQVSIHDGTGNDPDDSAMLDVQATDKGVLVPNVNITDLSTEAPVTAPADGLLVYNTNVGTGVGYHYWDDAAGEWVRLITSATTLHTGTGIAEKVAFWTTSTNLSANNNFHWNDGAGRLGIGTPSPSDNLEVAGGNVFISDATGMLKLKGSEGTTYELRPSQNATTGVAIRSQSNPATGENLFLVEPSGGSTRFGVTQSRGVWSPDGYWVGSYNTGIGSIINTGMFSPASNQLALSSDGSERIRIASDGNVGIGTTLPWQRLDVVGTTYLRAAPDNSIVAEQLRFGRQDSDIRYHSIYSLHNNGANSYLQFRIHDGGGSPFVAQTNALTLLGDGEVQLNSYTSNGLLMTTGGTGTLAVATGNDLPAGSNAYIQNQTGADQAAGFRIDGNGLFNGGSVGIGTVGPARALHVIDDARVDGNDGIEVRRGLHGGYGLSAPSSSNWGANIWTIGPSWQGTGYGTTYALAGSHYGLSWLRNSHPTTDAISLEGLHIHRSGTLAAAIGYSGSHFTNKVVIDGSVGIGTSTLTSKLIVDGGIGRTAHNNGHLEGSYNNVGPNSTRSNPIYTIGTSYNPTDDALDNMYGIGYSHTNATFLNASGPDTWGMYVAADGDARIWLGASSNGNSYFNTGGNIGLGNDAPDAKLDISASGNGTKVLRLNTERPWSFEQSLTGASTELILRSEVNGKYFRIENSTLGERSLSVLTHTTADSRRVFLVESGGRVGIGTTNPGYTLEVNGNIKSNAINETSDVRLKRNIDRIEGALMKVLGMNGVTYEWRTDEFPERDFGKGTQYGLIAQELEKVIPELVHTDEEGWKSIEYSHIVPLLIEAMKEQQNLIGLQASELNDLRAENQSMDERLKLLEESRHVGYQQTGSVSNHKK